MGEKKKESRMRINQAEFKLQDGKEGEVGRIAVFMYTGSGDPREMLDRAVEQYVGDEAFFELIDSHLDNPWTRVVLTHINEMKQEEFDPTKHRLSIIPVDRYDMFSEYLQRMKLSNVLTLPLTKSTKKGDKYVFQYGDKKRIPVPVDYDKDIYEILNSYKGKKIIVGIGSNGKLHVEDDKIFIATVEV